jgi:hypothetical protein
VRSSIGKKRERMPSGIASRKHEHPAVKGEKGSMEPRKFASPGAANFLQRFP